MFLKCHLCNDEFDEEKKHVRLLPCLHSLCFKCMKKTKLNDQLHCPTCDATHSVSDVDETCPRDNTRLDLMDLAKVKYSLMTDCCTVCPSEIATHRCTQCAEFLCDECHKAHMRVRATTNHTLVKLDEPNKNKNMDAFNRPLLFSERADIVLNNSCTKTSSPKNVCVNCAIDNCSESNFHKIINIDSVANAKRQLIKDQISSIEDVGKQIQKVLNEIKDEQNEIVNTEKSVKDKIDEAFDNLERILWNRRIHLNKELKNKVFRKQRHLKAQEDNLRKMKLDIEESNKFANLVVSCPSSLAFLQVICSLTLVNYS